jgi:hypothetical protein
LTLGQIRSFGGFDAIIFNNQERLIDVEVKPEFSSTGGFENGFETRTSR